MPVSYTEVLSNLWLMARFLLRVSITTGFAPWLVAFLVARKVYGREQVRRKARVLEFSSWGGRTVPTNHQGQICVLGAGARPSNARRLNV
jgi:hypothetical protein